LIRHASCRHYDAYATILRYDIYAMMRAAIDAAIITIAVTLPRRVITLLMFSISR